MWRAKMGAGRVRPAGAMVLLSMAGGLLLGACSTAPKESERASFDQSAAAAITGFRDHVLGLDDQLGKSGGYVVFPNVGQWGVIYFGGRYGRGRVYAPDGTPVGYAAINTPSLGLQLGVKGFRMLMVLEDQKAMDSFKAGNLRGNVGGVLVAGDQSVRANREFTGGAVVYQGAQRGLMAGVNVGLDWIRYQETEPVSRE